MAVHTDDLAAFIRQLGEGPAHVVGWSYGGAIAIVLTVHYPVWVKSLFVFEPGLATFVTDPADAQGAGEDRKNTRAPAAKGVIFARLTRDLGECYRVLGLPFGVSGEAELSRSREGLASRSLSRPLCCKRGSLGISSAWKVAAASSTLRLRVSAHRERSDRSIVNTEIGPS